MTSRTITIFLICFFATGSLSLFSSTAQLDDQKEKKELKMFSVKYNNIINDYKVTVDWYPHTAATKDSSLGKGEIHFTHSSGSEFKITHRNFYLVDIFFPFNEKTGELYLPAAKEITQDYIQYVDTSEFIETDLPFLFYDINFDGKDELILVHPNAAQRSRDYFAIYSINNDHIVENLPDESANLLSDYTFDSYTKFNKKHKTVTVFDSGGAAIYEERIYKNNKSNNRLELEEVKGADGAFSYNLKKPFGISQDSIESLFKHTVSYWDSWY